MVEPDGVPAQAFPQDRPPGMAVDGLPPTPIRQSADVAIGTVELHALLCSYSDTLTRIEKSPALLWDRPHRSPILCWLRLPAPRALVRSLLTRHISRHVSALRRCAARRVVLTNEAPGPLRDVTMLERFEQSLRPGPRLSLIAPTALLGTLLLAYLFAYWLKSSLSPLMAQLATAAVNLDREAAIEAFKKYPIQPHLYAGVAMFITWSVVLIIAPLLPAFSVKRRMLHGAQDIEARVFAALDCSRMNDFEPDLFAQVLLTAEVALLGTGLVVFAPIIMHDLDFHFRGLAYYGVLTSFCLMGVGLVCLTAAAAVELRNRYASRRTGAAPKYVAHRVITAVALWLVLGIAAYLWIDSVVAALNGGRAI